MRKKFFNIIVIITLLFFMKIYFYLDRKNLKLANVQWQEKKIYILKNMLSIIKI